VLHLLLTDDSVRGKSAPAKTMLTLSRYAPRKRQADQRECRIWRVNAWAK